MRATIQSVNFHHKRHCRLSFYFIAKKIINGIVKISIKAIVKRKAIDRLIAPAQIF
jgi:hypothetical protein